MRPIRTVTIAVILLITFFLLGIVGQSEKVMPNKDFSSFPLKIDGWIGEKSKLDEKVYNILGVEDYILANYRSPGNDIVNLYVGYYQSQKEGDIIHSPKNCMPGAGWNITETAIETIQFPNNIDTPVLKLVLMKGSQKQLVLYWFQSRGRIIASEYAQKLWLVYDSIVKNRTDGSFVRLIAPVSKDEETTLTTLKNFAEKIYPHLNTYIPS